MDDRQKRIIEEMGLNPKDFAPAEKQIDEVIDTLDAQITYTALMTDTLIPVEE